MWPKHDEDHVHIGDDGEQYQIVVGSDGNIKTFGFTKLQ